MSKIDLCSIADVRCYLTQDSTASDGELKRRITEISHRAQDHIARDFGVDTYVEIHDGGTRRIYPHNPPVTTVVSLVWDDFAGFQSAFVLTENVDFTVVNRGWDVAYVIGRFPGRENSIKITYTAGFKDAKESDSTLPVHLRAAIAKQVVYEFRHRDSFGVRTTDYADGEITRETDRNFLRLVNDVLKDFAPPKVG